MSLRAASALVWTSVLVGAAHADEAPVPAGSYEITHRLELPHLERWAVETKTTACVSETRGTGNALPPVLSDNTPFAGCSAENVRHDRDNRTYDIVCDGRDAAKAQASYTLTSGGFLARITMTLGAKNMTMTEVQVGRRVGSCDLASVRQD